MAGTAKATESRCGTSEDPGEARSSLVLAPNGLAPSGAGNHQHRFGGQPLLQDPDGQPGGRSLSA